MGTLNTDKAWKAYGASNPYYGVLAHDQYLNEALTDESKTAFFTSGKNYISTIWNLIESHFEHDYRPEHALDFGCGTGRLILPLARKAKLATGVDVSQNMLNEAKANASAMRIDNVNFMLSDDWLKQVQPGQYDFVNSYIVLQHINESRGLFFFEKLVEAVAENGIGALQITFENRKTAKERFINYFRYRVPLLNNLLNVIRGKKIDLPLMQMTTYNLNHLFMILQRLGVHQFHAAFTDHGGHHGVLLLFKKGNRLAI